MSVSVYWYKWYCQAGTTPPNSPGQDDLSPDADLPGQTPLLTTQSGVETKGLPRCFPHAHMYSPTYITFWTYTWGGSLREALVGVPGGWAVCCRAASCPPTWCSDKCLSEASPSKRSGSMQVSARTWGQLLGSPFVSAPLWAERRGTWPVAAGHGAGTLPSVTPPPCWGLQLSRTSAGWKSKR